MWLWSQVSSEEGRTQLLDYSRCWFSFCLSFLTTFTAVAHSVLWQSNFPPLTQEARFPHQGPHGSQAWTLPPARPLWSLGPGRPTATLLQSLLWLCQPLQICLWKPNWPAGTPALQASFRSKYWWKEYAQRWGWHGRSRDLLRDLGGPPREVGVGCSSPCGQGHWYWGHQGIIFFSVLFCCCYCFIYFTFSNIHIFKNFLTLFFTFCYYSALFCLLSFVFCCSWFFLWVFLCCFVSFGFLFPFIFTFLKLLFLLLSLLCVCLFFS